MQKNNNVTLKMSKWLVTTRIRKYHTLDFRIHEKSKKAPYTSAMFLVRSITWAVRPKKEEPKNLNNCQYDGKEKMATKLNESEATKVEGKH